MLESPACAAPCMSSPSTRQPSTAEAVWCATAIRNAARPWTPAPPWQSPSSLSLLVGEAGSRTGPPCLCRLTPVLMPATCSSPAVLNGCDVHRFAPGVFVGGEAGVSYSTMKPGAPGRPNLIIAGAGIVSLVAVRVDCHSGFRLSTIACYWTNPLQIFPLGSTMTVVPPCIAIPMTSAACPHFKQASQLVGSTGTPSAGLMAGTAACGALMAWSAKRFADTGNHPYAEAQLTNH